MHKAYSRDHMSHDSVTAPYMYSQFIFIFIVHGLAGISGCIFRSRFGNKHFVTEKYSEIISPAMSVSNIDEALQLQRAISKLILSTKSAFLHAILPDS